MDLPVFHFDGLNDRVLIAVIAILHVIINHGMAVGGIPLVAYLERRSVVTGDEGWDRTAWRLLKFFFVITTSVGAMTGVGIWLSAGLVNPIAIGSLLRVFFWTWFVEWLVFVSEVALILAYYLTWQRWTGTRKRGHVRLGFALAGASWATMALIVSILGFMMDPGAWHSNRTLLSGMFNPLYLPQLAFRTPIAMVLAGVFALATLRWIAPAKTTPAALRGRITRSLAIWVLAWIPICIAGGLWYASAVPDAMRANVPVALLTQALAQWASQARWVLAGSAALIAAVAAWAAWRRRSPTWAGVLAAVLAIALVGMFERVREFVRKPYAIGGYLYSNSYRVEDYPLLQRDGLLALATYTAVRAVDPRDPAPAGREVFRLACTRCHTVDGVNSIRGALRGLYGDGAWDADAIDRYVGTMHNIRTFMPPFPGSLAERHALAVYLASLRDRTDEITGAQDSGVVALPRRARP